MEINKYKVIAVREGDQEVPFAGNAASLKMGCIENLSDHDIDVYVKDRGGTVVQLRLSPNDRIPCVLSESDAFARAVDFIQIREDTLTFLSSDNLYLLYDGDFRFYRDGRMEVEGPHGMFRFGLSDYGNPYVYANHGAVIDTEGNVKAKEDSRKNWSRMTLLERCPQEHQYLYAMNANKERAGITFDRKAVYQGAYINGIDAPVMDISLCSTGLWVLTVKGQIYLVDVEKNLDAVLIAEGAVAISSGVYQRFFAFADASGDLHVYNCYHLKLITEEDGTYLAAEYERDKVKKYTPNVIHPNRGRISELCIHNEEVAVRYINGGRDILNLITGKSVRRKW